MHNDGAGMQTLDQWQSAAVAIMCATSLTPIVNRFAKPRTRRVFDEGLRAVWRSVSEQQADVQACDVRAELDTLPESECDDSNTPEYDVMVAIGVLAYALDALVKEDWLGSVKYACSLAAQYYSGIDYVIAHGTKPQRTNPNNPMPLGPLESRLRHSQRESIRIIGVSARLTNQIIDRVRVLSSQVASDLEGALSMYVEQRKWPSGD
jgi:hypothetical protein